MIAYAADPTLNMSNARDLYFEYNHFGADGGYNDAWVDFKFGPIPLPFPNTAARVRAVRFHDLHHVLTGYNTDTIGEFEISAWELGSGCADFMAAWQLNLMGMFAGVFMAPKRIWHAWVRGRHSRNVYGMPYEPLLARHVGELRTELRLDRDPPAATAADVGMFAFYLVAGFTLGLMAIPFFLPLAIAVNVAALFRRRTAPTV